jgi:hypothetical protein
VITPKILAQLLIGDFGRNLIILRASNRHAVHGETLSGKLGGHDDLKGHGCAVIHMRSILGNHFSRFRALNARIRILMLGEIFIPFLKQVEADSPPECTRDLLLP